MDMTTTYDGTLLDHLAEHMMYLSAASSFWFSLNSSYDHDCHLSKRLGMSPQDYEYLLVAAKLAQFHPKWVFSINILIGGPQEKMSFFQIASGPILSIPIYLKTCLYGPCKFSLKKMTPSLPTNPPKSAFFCTSDWTSDWLGFTSDWPCASTYTE